MKRADDHDLDLDDHHDLDLDQHHDHLDHDDLDQHDDLGIEVGDVDEERETP